MRVGPFETFPTNPELPPLLERDFGVGVCRIMFRTKTTATSTKSFRISYNFWVQKKSGEQLVIEVKPKQQLKPPKKPKRQTQRYLREVHTFAINQRKFEVAEEFCRNRGMKFVIFTQDELGIIG